MEYLQTEIRKKHIEIQKPYEAIFFFIQASVFQALIYCAHLLAFISKFIHKFCLNILLASLLLLSDDGWHESTRALISIGLIGNVICIGIAVVFIYFQSLERHRKLLIFALLIATIVTGKSLKLLNYFIIHLVIGVHMCLNCIENVVVIYKLSL